VILLAHLLPAAVAALCRRRPQSPLPYPPDPVPLDWQAIEPRWDCQVCRCVRPAEIHPGGFRCLHCQTETSLATA
jgi:hypothetical protein